MTSNIISSRGRHSSQVLVCLTRSFLTVYYIQRQLSKALSTDPQSSVVMHICSDVYDYMISLPFPIFFSFFLSWIYMFPRGSEWLPTQSSFFFSLFKSSTFLRRLLCIHARSTRNICKRWKRIACRLFIGSQKNQTISVEKRKKEGRKTTVSVVVLFLGGNQSRIWNYMERKRTWTRIRHYVSLYVRCIFCNAPYQRKSVRAYQHNRRMEQEHTHTKKQTNRKDFCV